MHEGRLRHRLRPMAISGAYSIAIGRNSWRFSLKTCDREPYAAAGVEWFGVWQDAEAAPKCVMQPQASSGSAFGGTPNPKCAMQPHQVVRRSARRRSQNVMQQHQVVRRLVRRRNQSASCNRSVGGFGNLVKRRSLQRSPVGGVASVYSLQGHVDFDDADARHAKAQRVVAPELGHGINFTEVDAKGQGQVAQYGVVGR